MALDISQNNVNLTRKFSLWNSLNKRMSQSSADHILQHDLLPVRLDHLGGPGSVSVRLDFD
ncbi:unnamed protein product [Pocillopora meandrina]|nr:unnamed protein product [Pocillopora meandrina]